MMISEDVLLGTILSTTLVLFRIAAFFAVSPVFGATFITGQVRALLALMMALMVAPLVPAAPNVDPTNLPAIIPMILQEMAIGIAMGFVIQILFQMFVLAGQAIAMQAGLGFATMVDPSNGVSVPVISQFYIMLVTLLWLSMGGHLIMLEILVESYTLQPVGQVVGLLEGLALIPKLGGWMFAGGLLMALPAVAAMLVVNLAFGVMTRTAPQLNVFALGFPFTLMSGLVALWLSLEGFLPRFEIFAAEALDTVRQVIIGGSGG